MLICTALGHVDFNAQFDILNRPIFNERNLQLHVLYNVIISFFTIFWFLKTVMDVNSQ